MAVARAASLAGFAQSGSANSTAMPMLLAPAWVSRSISRACSARGQGQLPSCSRLWSSMAITTGAWGEGCASGSSRS
jgi:hypothetical protein